jgi:hypothetical protein
MFYCYYPITHYRKLSEIEKFIANKYLRLNCILENKIKLTGYSEDLIVYSEKGLLKQLNLFKKFENKFIYIKKIKNNNFRITTKENKLELLLTEYISKKSNTNPILESILMGKSNNQIKKIMLYVNIIKYPKNKIKKLKCSIKYDKNMNWNKELEWKYKAFEENGLKDEFYNDIEQKITDSKKIIKETKNSKEFQDYYKKNVNKFKKYSFEKEIKEIKKSIFFTCKVKTKYNKLFPNY